MLKISNVACFYDDVTRKITRDFVDCPDVAVAWNFWVNTTVSQ